MKIKNLKFLLLSFFYLSGPDGGKFSGLKEK